MVFHELKKIDEKIVVIPNGFEKFMAFILNKNLVFIDSMQFMNSSFEKQKLAKNVLDDDFKYLIQEFGSKNLYIYIYIYKTNLLLHEQVCLMFNERYSCERYFLNRWA